MTEVLRCRRYPTVKGNRTRRVEKERAVLAAQREAMNEIGKLREDLARAREEKAALEVLIARSVSQKPDPEQPLDKKGGPGAGKQHR